MKTENLEKLEKILLATTNEERRYQASFRRTLAIYVVIALVVGIYTCWIASKLQETLTPRNVAVLLNTQLRDTLPEMRTKLRGMMRPMAKQLADQAVVSGLNLIPAATQFLRTEIDRSADQMMLQFEQENMTQLEKFMSKNIDEVMKNRDVVKDSNVSEALLQTVMKDLKTELDKVVNNEALADIANLRFRLKNLRDKPVSEMTRQEYAERMFIVYWLHLVDKAPLK